MRVQNLVGFLVSLAASLFVLLALAERAVADEGPYASNSVPCVRNKAQFEKADERLKKAFAENDPFAPRTWRGGMSDIVINEKGAEVRVHQEYAFAASFTPWGVVHPIKIFEACIDLNNKPYYRIGDEEKLAQKAYLGQKQVTLGQGMEKDAYTIDLVKPLPAAASAAESRAPSIQKKVSPVVN